MPKLVCAASLPVERARETKYEGGVRWSVLAACVFGLALAGCWNPKVGNGGFACAPMDNPPCPTGYYCVDGLCLDHPGPAVTSGGDMASGTGGNGADFATTPVDMAGADLSSQPGDMAQSGGADMTMCGAANDFCLKSAECCSGVCFLFSCF